MESYVTLRRQASDEFVVQKSRFIGYCAPCETEEEALAFLRAVRDKTRDATHHCYAYVIGRNEGIMRYSDDGEPGGTAGLPILEVMRGRRVVNGCVVVVRYFGGTLLGTGGLVRAYTQACRIALAAGETVCMEWTCRDLCEVPYPVWDSVRYALDRLPARAEELSFATAVSFTLLTRQKDREQVLETLQKITGRKLDFLPESEGYASWELPALQDDANE